MVLHLVPDEKVVPRTINLFEKYNPGGNIFVVFSNGSKKLKFVQESESVFLDSSKAAKQLKAESIDVVIFHFLNNAKLRFFYKHKLHDKITYWIVWGGDLYRVLYARGKYKIYSDENSFLKIPTDYSQNLIYKRLKWNKPFARFCTKTIMSVVAWYTEKYQHRFFHNYLDYVYNTRRGIELIKDGQRFKRFKGNLDFCYYPIEDTLGDLAGKWCEGNNIMIGNSANASNNHEYVLKYLQKLDTSNYSITVPLSYGGNDEYISIIKEKYNKLPNAKCLMDFLPIEKYNEVLLSSTIGIYGQFRGEAWGNILTSLYLGSKIYLSKYNPMYTNCQDLGFWVFELEEIGNTFNLPFTQEEKDHNRKVALEKFSREKNAEYIRKICSLKR